MPKSGAFKIRGRCPDIEPGQAPGHEFGLGRRGVLPAHGPLQGHHGRLARFTHGPPGRRLKVPCNPDVLAELAQDRVRVRQGHGQAEKIGERSRVAISSNRLPGPRSMGRKFVGLVQMPTWRIRDDLQTWGLLRSIAVQFSSWPGSRPTHRRGGLARRKRPRICRTGRQPRGGRERRRCPRTVPWRKTPRHARPGRRPRNGPRGRGRRCDRRRTGAGPWRS